MPVLRRRTLGLSLAALLLLTACGSAARPAPSPEPAPTSGTDRWYPTVGAEAKEAGGTNALTREKVLLSQLRGQVVYVNFWATWCPPCKEEMPALNILNQEMAGKVRFLAFDSDGSEDMGDMAKFAKEMNISLPLIWDEGKAGRTYLVTGIPISFVIGRDGKITGKRLGVATRQQMLDLIATAGT